MSFAKLVPLSRSISLLTRDIPAKRVRLVYFVIFFAVVLSGLPAHPKYNIATTPVSEAPKRCGQKNSE
jgi:hypothetical protein